MGEKIPYVPVEAWALSKAESEPGIQLAESETQILFREPCAWQRD